MSESELIRSPVYHALMRLENKIRAEAGLGEEIFCGSFNGSRAGGE